MSIYTEEEDNVQFSEPILAQKNVKAKISFVEKTTWKNKVDGQAYDACKLTIQITDESVKTEHADSKPKLVIEDQFNIVQYPYIDKKTGEIKKLGKQKLYQLEQAFGFDPVFKVNGEVVAPFVTKNGNKVAPKIDGVKHVINPDFFNAYFTSNGEPAIDNWLDKNLCVDIEVEHSEQFGSKNVIARYLKANVI